MTVSIFSNLAALGITRQLEQSSLILAGTFERLSSGMRINRAADDPAGLAVSSGLQAQSRIFNRARQNVSDGLSLLQIADGTLNEVSALVSRMAELAQQAANGTFSRVQRLTLNREYQALGSEIIRISEATRFNGLNLLRGEALQGPLTGSGLNSASSVDISADGKYGVWRDGTFKIINFETGRIEDTGITPSTATSALITVKGDLIFQDSTALQPRDVFFYQRETGILTKIADRTGMITPLTLSALSADGSTYVFASTQYFNGPAGTPWSGSGAARLVVFDTENMTLRTIEQDLTDFTTDLKISADGTKAALVSAGDYARENPDNSYEIFVFDILSRVPSIKQMTSVAPLALNSAVLAGVTGGGKVIFVSSADLVGGNPGGTFNQIYSVDQSGIRQITNVNMATTFSGLTMSTEGGALFFASKSNCTGENPDQMPQFFRLDIEFGFFRQLSNYTSSQFEPNSTTRISQDGLRAVVDIDLGAGTSLLAADLAPRASSFDFEAGFGASGRILADIEGLLGAVRGLGGNAISSRTGAQAALDNMTANMDHLGRIKGVLGAGLSRLEAAGRLLESQIVEINAADGRIRDSDMTAESAALVRQTILQQAASALLAQANLQPSLALLLLEQ